MLVAVLKMFTLFFILVVFWIGEVHFKEDRIQVLIELGSLRERFNGGLIGLLSKYGVSENHFLRFLSVSPNPSESIAYAFASHESPEERKSTVSQSKTVNIAEEVTHGIEMDDKVTNGIVNLGSLGDVLPDIYEKRCVIEKHQSNEAFHCSRPHSKVQLMGLLTEYVEDRHKAPNTHVTGEKPPITYHLESEVSCIVSRMYPAGNRSSLGDDLRIVLDYSTRADSSEKESLQKYAQIVVTDHPYFKHWRKIQWCKYELN